MGGTRNFAAQHGNLPDARNVDNDAPQPMRQEILAAAYEFLSIARGFVSEEQIYYGIEQMLGIEAAGNPMAGRRQRLGRDLANAEWTRVYDILSWLWSQFRRAGLEELFRQNINQILAFHGAAWDLGEDGHLSRVLPAAAHAQVVAAIAELGQPAYAPALALFTAAKDAYNARPRRDRDACSNVFDALESVAKVKYGLPNDTFGGVKNHIQQNMLLRPEIVDVFTALNRLRNAHFGHGMAVPFGVSVAEVDFVYLTCLASILLLTRTH